VNYVGEHTLTLYRDVAGVPSDIQPHSGKGEGHTAVLRRFVDAVRSGEWAEHSGQEGLARTRIIDGCYRSARDGREVTLG